MLTLNLLLRIPKYPIAVPILQPLTQCIRFCSSSSDSSDSDSDIDEKKQKDAIKTETSKTPECETTFYLNQALNSLINKQISRPKEISRPVDVAMQPKKKKEVQKVKSIPFEKKMINAVKDVAATFGGDAQKTETDLMKQIFPPQEMKPDKKKNKKKVQSDSPTPRLDLSELISGMQIDTEPDPKSYRQKRIAAIQALRERNQSISPSQRREQPEQNQRSVIETLRGGSGQFQFPYRDRRNSFHASDGEFLWTGKPMNIFQKVPEPSTTGPVLSTWDKLEQKYLKLSITHTPENIFQELILWTEQGKLWKFPIDNEQGLEKEQSVPFSDHVFLERHLKGWCPTRGPIRHFMELVCVGLSKSPYLTVEEKVEHITWYKEYFGSKRDVLESIGAFDTSTVETKQIES